MAWQQIAVLLVLSLTFRASEGWQRMSRSKGASESSQWKRVDRDDYSTEGQAVVQVAESPKAKEVMESPNFVNYADSGFQVQFTDVTKLEPVTKREPVTKAPNVIFKLIAKTREPVIEPAVLCSDYEFNVTLPAGWPLREVKILGSKMLPVFDANALESCGYLLTRGRYQNTLSIPFSGCQSHVSLQAGRHVLRVLYVDEAGKMDIATISCEASPESSKPTVNLSIDGPQFRRLPTSKCPNCDEHAVQHKHGDTPKKVHKHDHDPWMHVHEPPKHDHHHHEPPKHDHHHHEPPKHDHHHHEPPKHDHHHHEPPKHDHHHHHDPSKHQSGGCNIPKPYQLACGSSHVSSSACLSMGCCVSELTSDCYYPMDECTMDKQFVFVLHHDIAAVHVDPTKLSILGKDGCKPVVANDKFAIFKFKVNDCSTRSYYIGDTMVYLVEVHSAVQALNLKYGIITRDDPLRVMVECRYPKSDSGLSVASVGYMVMNPSLPSILKSEGLFGVELRIAKDKSYSSYLTHYHQPLNLLLGKPVYLEIRLKSAKPEAVVLVNYCLAYPRSASNALVLVHEGCANPLDPNVSIMKVDDLPQNRHQRRFVVTAFQFMDQKTNQYLNEEIYFMCSTEVCMPTEKHCEERCFDGKPS